MTSETNIKRMVLALPADGASDTALDVAITLARSLRLELVALLLEDESSFLAVANPNAIEVVDGSQTVRPLDTVRLEHDYGLFRRRVERRLKAVADRAEMALACESVRGPIGRTLLDDLGETDLLAVFDPPSVLARAFGALPNLAKELGAAKRVLAVPAEPTARGGKIVLLAGERADPSSEVFARTLARLENAVLEIWKSGIVAEEAGAAAPVEDVIRSTRDLETDRAMRRRLAQECRLLIVDPRARESIDFEKVIRLSRHARTPILTLSAAPSQPREGAAPLDVT